MIVVKLKGGLGNQLFQYAMARRIAYREHSQLKLDLSEYQNHNLRKYRLNNFNIISEVASPEEIALVKMPRGGKTNSIKLRLIEKCRPYYKRHFIKESFFHFDPNILKISGDIYLEGYWQSEKYFIDIEHIIRQEITLKNDPDLLNEEIIKNMDNVQSVSVHVRRGDYILDSTINQFHGCCSVDYYHHAIDEMVRYIDQPSFFIFSDDPEWVQENLDIDYPSTIIKHNRLTKDYEDLRLMSFCKHHIIANSTFSWWGAWLCAHKEKIVISPKKWFNKAELNTRDLIPESWLRI
jgi:hypothetical protein